MRRRAWQCDLTFFLKFNDQLPGIHFQIIFDNRIFKKPFLVALISSVTIILRSYLFPPPYIGRYIYKRYCRMCTGIKHDLVGPALDDIEELLEKQ